MGSEITTAVVGLLGVVVGAITSLAGTIWVERQRARQVANERYLASFAGAIVPGDEAKAAAIQSKLWLGTVANREALQRWQNAQSAEADLEGLIDVVAHLVNDVRRTNGQSPLPRTAVGTLIRGRNYP